MSRVRARSLVLVNWKGVFYERYHLDPHVTALEGQNGAGKTTVMIAAYLVLLPDLARLRFTNLGETAATGGDRGIYGRLGGEGSPSYAVIDFGLPGGERLLAGVHIRRKAEPTIELSCFQVAGLAPDVALQDVLLERGVQDVVPELPALREQVARQGGRLKVFAGPGEYFSRLFDLGVTPLRLSADEERRKFHHMLQTSMVGGISKTLTGGLREFLLREETGLADTLRRMQASLESCRGTRTQVGMARKMEAEVREVFEAGASMFEAAVHAIREAAEELEEQVRRAEEALEAGTAAARGLAKEVEDIGRELGRVLEELAATRREVEVGQEALTRLREAHRIAERIRNRRAEREPAQASAIEALRAREVAEEAWAAARERRRRAQIAVEQASRGLGDLEEGLERLRRRAAAFGLATRRLADVRTATARPDLGPEGIPAVLREWEAKVRELDSRIATLDRELSTAEARTREYREVLGALEEWSGGLAPGADPRVAARRLQVEREGLERKREALPGLPGEIAEARERAGRQRRLREELADLRSDEDPLGTAQEIRRAFGAADVAHGEALQQDARVRDAREEGRRTLVAVRQEVRELEEASVQWGALRAGSEALAEGWQHPLASLGDYDELELRVLAELDEVRRAGRQEEERVRELLREAEAFELEGGAFDPALLRARDRVEGRLVAGLFEDIEVDEAAELEARLGPLASALLVEDVAGAGRVLDGLEGAPDTVWLIDSTEGALAPERATTLERSVVVEGTTGTRVTRVPSRPTLGRRARMAKVRELRSEAGTREIEAERLRRRARGIGEDLRRLRELMGRPGVIERGDPGEELAAAKDRERGAETAMHRAEQQAHAAQVALAAARTRRDALARLLPDADLVDLPDQEARVRELETRLREGRAAAAELERTDAAARAVLDRLDVLRSPPPSDAELARWREELDDRRGERDRSFETLESLRYLDENAVELTWSDAPEALREQLGLRPALDEQLRRANEEQARAAQGEDEAEATLREARDAENLASAALAQLDAALARDREELEATGVEDASSEALAAKQSEVARCLERARELEARNTERNAALSEVRTRFEIQEQNVEGLRRERDDKVAKRRPVQERWEGFRGRAEASGVLAAALTPEAIQRNRGRGSVNLYQDAQTLGMVLVERLVHTESGREVGEAARVRFSAIDEVFGGAYLDVWLETREWLRRRVPPQVAEVDDPLLALGRIRDHLAQLEERLVQQEGVLRGQAEDVARNIEIQIRRARQSIRRINEDLEAVHFGSIDGVKIEVSRVEARDRVLAALKQEVGQQLLFESELPVEEAMDELFRRVAGGRTGGQRLLDYREYIDLRVRIRRQGREDWEVANPTRMSTGEAIGVGAAIMMVVLTAWEKQASLLRSKRTAGSVRMLFLDEANRLSQDNLGVLFELCQNLELQLLIAAPEVAQSEGNTTYHLVRRVDTRGQEIVHVTGRRTTVRSRDVG